MVLKNVFPILSFNFGSIKVGTPKEFEKKFRNIVFEQLSEFCDKYKELNIVLDPTFELARLI